jgi:hypothetical protein
LISDDSLRNVTLAICARMRMRESGVLHAACNLLHAACNLLHAACNLLHAVHAA